MRNLKPIGVGRVGGGGGVDFGGHKTIVVSAESYVRAAKAAIRALQSRPMPLRFCGPNARHVSKLGAPREG